MGHFYGWRREVLLYIILASISILAGAIVLFRQLFILAVYCFLHTCYIFPGRASRPTMEFDTLPAALSYLGERSTSCTPLNIRNRNSLVGENSECFFFICYNIDY